MSLMEGLSGDLEGTLVMENKAGTIIKVSFAPDLRVIRRDPVSPSFVSNQINGW